MKKLLKNKKEISLLVKVMAMVVALISVTFSWFVFAKDAWVNPFEVGVTKVIDVTISKEEYAILEKMNKDSLIRGETLKPEEFAVLANLLFENKNK